MNEIGEKIKLLRLSYGLTQEQLANEITNKYNYPINSTMVSLCENGKRIPNLDFIICLSKVFSCTTDYLLGTTMLNKVIEEEELEELKYILIKKFIKTIDTMKFDEIIDIVNFISKYD